MDKATLLAGLKIIKVEGEYAHVSVNWNAFNALRGTNPAIPFAVMRDASGQPVRAFNIDGTMLFSCYKRGDVAAGTRARTTFIMKAAEAKALGAVDTANLGFSASAFAA